MTVPGEPWPGPEEPPSPDDGPRTMTLTAGGGGEGDSLPGQPWPGPTEEPHPDGGSPEGDGDHRK
ncbi:MULTISPECIES: hypothetical protein [unclassified Streptomyces]|uniref:hypothetical protein n=1 Tax=unclassified Streptomyces TaxID=2593676 RepID=UPI00381B9CF9